PARAGLHGRAARAHPPAAAGAVRLPRQLGAGRGVGARRTHAGRDRPEPEPGPARRRTGPRPLDLGRSARRAPRRGSPAGERRPLQRSLLLALVLLLPLAAPAQVGSREGEDASAHAGRGVLSFTFENDMWAGTDRYYTSGHRFGWQSRGGAPAPLARAGGWLAPWLLPE